MPTEASQISPLSNLLSPSMIVRRLTPVSRPASARDDARTQPLPSSLLYSHGAPWVMPIFFQRSDPASLARWASNLVCADRVRICKLSSQLSSLTPFLWSTVREAHHWAVGVTPVAQVAEKATRTCQNILRPSIVTRR